MSVQTTHTLHTPTHTRTHSPYTHAHTTHTHTHARARARIHTRTRVSVCVSLSLSPFLSLTLSSSVSGKQWFTVAPFAYKGRWRNFHVLGALSSELNFNTFFQLFGSLFCCAVSSCVHDHNHPYLVSERLFLAENKAFPYLRRALAHPRRALAILWDAAATWPVVIFMVVAAKQRSPKISVACVLGPVARLLYRTPPVTLNGHCSVIFQLICKPNISFERSCPDLNEHVLFLWIRRETAERRPFEVCRRIDFAIGRIKTEAALQQSYRLSKVVDKLTALEALTWRKNETQCSGLFIFQFVEAKENAKTLTCCLKKHKQYLQTIVTYDTPSPRKN